MKKIITVSLFLVLALNANEILDANTTTTSSIFKNFTLGASLSSFNSKSHETIYMPTGYPSAGRKISELTWEAKNVKLFGVNLAYKKDSVTFFINYKKNISSGDGVVDDLDWTDNANPDKLTHWSHHDNTDVTNISILDLGLKKHLLIKDIKAYISVGYKQENQIYKAYDGYGNYDGTPVTFSGLGITFEQQYDGVYLSLGTEVDYEKFIFSIDAKYSPFINAKYIDTHHFRYFTTTTNFSETTMTSIKLSCAYNINDFNNLGLAYEYNKYDYVRGDRTRDYDDGSSSFFGNSAALDSVNSFVEFKYNYLF